MSDIHRFHIDCTPSKVTAQQKGIRVVGKHAMHYKKKKVVDAEATLAALLAQNRPSKPFAGPIKVTILWAYPFRSGEPLYVHKLGFRWCDTRPDCDNLSKSLADCMTKLNFWGDDSQIAWLDFRKGWSVIPGITIQIEALPEPTKETSPYEWEDFGVCAI